MRACNPQHAMPMTIACPCAYLYLPILNIWACHDYNYIL